MTLFPPGTYPVASHVPSIVSGRALQQNQVPGQPRLHNVKPMYVVHTRNNNLTWKTKLGLK